MPGPRETPDLVRHCVAAVAKQYGGDTSKAFAICVAQLQKSGYLKPGTMELTAAGKKKEKEHEAEPDAEKKLAAYEKLLKAAREESVKQRLLSRLEDTKPVNSSASKEYNDFFERLTNPTSQSGFEALPTTVARRYDTRGESETAMQRIRRLAGIGNQ